MNPKTVFFDIDGTLLGTKDGRRFQIPESTISALNRLRQNGHRIAVCSGRQERFIEKYFPGLFESFIAMNGTHIVFEGKTIYDRPFSGKEVMELSRRFNLYGCRYVFVGRQFGWAGGFGSGGAAWLDTAYGLDGFAVDRWEPGDVRANVMDFFFESREELSRWKPAFSPEMQLNIHPGGHSADLCIGKNDKADGIARFLEYSGIRKEDTIAFGDGYNDVSMMGAVGLGVAMGNAVDEVKKAAGYVTDDIFGDGIYKGLKHLNLI